jgi:WD40 repeat protein
MKFPNGNRMCHLKGSLSIAVAILCLFASVVMAGPDAGNLKPVDFESELLPVFKANCLACHSSSKAKGGLNLETPQTILNGSDSGVAVVPGKGNESFLYQVTANLVEDTVMPPKDNKSNALPFTTSELELLRRWIDEGAKGEVRGTRTLQWQAMPPGLQAVHAVALSPDGSLVVCGRANQIHAYHVSSRQLEARLGDPSLADSNIYGMQGAAHLDFVQSLAFSPNSRLLASGGYRVIKLWKRTFETEASQAELKTFFPNQTCCSSITANGNIAVRDISNQRPRLEFGITGHHFACAEISPDHALLAAGSLEGNLCLWRLVDGQLIHREKQIGAVRFIKWLPDQSGLFTAGRDTLIRKWTLTKEVKDSMRLQSVWEAHEGEVRTLELVSAPIPLLVSGGTDGLLKCWNLEDEALNQTITTDKGIIRGFVFNETKNQSITLSDNGSLLVWNVETGEQIMEMQPHSKEGQNLAAAERKQAMVESWLKANQADLKSLEEASNKAKERQKKAKEALDAAEKQFKDKEHAVHLASEKASQERQALNQLQDDIQKASEAFELAETKANEAKVKALEAAHPSEPTDEKSHVDFQSLEVLIKETAEQSFAAGRAKEAFDHITANKDDKLEQLQKAAEESEKLIKQLEGELAPLKMTFSLAKTEWNLATKSEQSNATALEQMQQTIAERERQLNMATMEVEQHQTAANPLSIGDWMLSVSLDGTMLAAVSADGSWRTWNIIDGTPLECGQLNAQTVDIVLARPNGNGWLIASDNSLSVLNSKPTWVLDGILGTGNHDSPIRDRVNALAFSPDGTWLVAGGGEPSRSGELTIWNMDHRTLSQNLDRIHSDAILGLAFSPDGQFLASAGTDKFARVLDWHSKKILLNLEGHTHHVMDVTWKADGRLLATAGADKVVKIWDYPSGNRKKNVEGFEKEITSVCFAGLNDQLIAASGDATMRLINTEGKEIRRFESIPDFQQSTSITPDGNMIATGGDDGSIRIYHTDRNQPDLVFEAP